MLKSGNEPRHSTTPMLRSQIAAAIALGGDTLVDDDEETPPSSRLLPSTESCPACGGEDLSEADDEDAVNAADANDEVSCTVCRDSRHVPVAIASHYQGHDASTKVVR